MSSKTAVAARSSDTLYLNRGLKDSVKVQALYHEGALTHAYDLKVKTLVDGLPTKMTVRQAAEEVCRRFEREVARWLGLLDDSSYSLVLEEPLNLPDGITESTALADVPPSYFPLQFRFSPKDGESPVRGRIADLSADVLLLQEEKKKEDDKARLTKQGSKGTGNDFAELKASVAALMKTVEAQQATIDKQKLRNDMLEQRMGALEVDNAGLRHEIDELKKENAKLRKDTEDLRKAVAGHQGAVCNIRLRILLDEGRRLLLTAIGFDNIKLLRVAYTKNQENIKKLVKMLKSQSVDMRARRLADPTIVEELVWPSLSRGRIASKDKTLTEADADQIRNAVRTVTGTAENAFLAAIFKAVHPDEDRVQAQ